jgi:hypothetical protein
MSLIEDISDEKWEFTFKVNIHAMFYLTKANFGADEAAGSASRACDHASLRLRTSCWRIRFRATSRVRRSQ